VALSFALPILGVLAVTYWQTKSKVRADLQLIAQSSVAHAERVLASVEGSLGRIVNNHLTSCSEEDRSLLQYFVYSKIEVRSFGIAKPETFAIECTDTLVTSGAGASNIVADLMRGKPGTMQITPPQKDLLGEVSVFAGLRNEGTKLVFAAVYPQQFWDFQDALGLSEGGSVVLIDEAGRTIASLRDSTGGSAPIRADLGAGYTQTADYHAFSASSKMYPIRAVSTVSNRSVLAHWRTMALALVPVMLFASALSGWILWRYGRRTESMGTRLTKALYKDEVHLVYQPIVRVDDPSVVISVEALARWRDPLLGDVPPDRFVPAATREGVLPQLSAWVFRRAIKDLTDILDSNPTLRVSINIGRDDLNEWGELYKAIDAAPHVLNRFIFEVTERESLADRLDEAGRVLAHWRKLGAQIALDDFGTGCCNLSYLRLLPIDIVKLDREFSASLDSPQKALDNALFDAVQSLLTVRDLTVVVEGVERETQHAALRVRQSSLAQGWFYAKPMNVHALRDLLKQSQGR
jgi:sensor c-di-GMP phosphodiesterase-like protein